MAIHLFVPLGLALLQAAQPRSPQQAADASAQARAVQEMRNVGTAMFSWLTDAIEADSAHASSEADSACVSYDKESEVLCATVQIDKLPLLSHKELVRLLVPAYIAAIPEKDPWGHPYEFRLRSQHVLNKTVLAIRSPGGDGAYSGSRYQNGAFPSSDVNQDLVWMDGFFIRWPEQRAAANPPGSSPRRRGLPPAQ